MPDDFVHLHVHSEYSLLDGLGSTRRLAERAAELGQPALAITDHGAMHGAIEFSRTAHKAGIKPILGVEAYLTQYGRPMQGRDGELDRGRHHLLLLAQNLTGYRNLLKLCSDAQLQGYYYRPRVDADYLAAHSAGLICTSGCLAAELPTLLKNGQEDLALKRLQWYRDVFGPDRWYIEFQEHNIPELTQVNKQLFAWARQYDLPMIVTNDVHYVKEEDAGPHDMLLCVQTSSLVTDPNRMRYEGGSYFLKDLAQMRQTFLPLADLPESAFSNTVKIAEMCDVDPEDSTYHLPDMVIPAGYTYQTYLRRLTEEGMRHRYRDRADDPEVLARKEHELQIIHEMGFDVYYLIVWDLCMYAKQRGIWWNVRGSGAGSIVAYALGVTNLDPLRNKLIFERFLNPGRVTMPDFDLDFPDDQREELIRYTVDKYGQDQVAQIVTFGRMKARAAVRDVGRAMDVPLPEVDRLAKMIPAIPGKPVTINDVLTEGNEFYSTELRQRYESEEHVRQLLDTASHLEGVARHSSIHAAAVIVADKPLTHYTPLMRPPRSAITETVTQYEYPILESIGLLKIDFLGLATLTLMREATRLIRERHGVEYTLENLPIDDPTTYELLTSGDVLGVFQVESQGMRRCLMDLRPTEFDHITATISLYRPGPMEFIPDFIAVLHGEQAAHYVHPILEPILAETMGVCVSGDALVMDVRTGRRCRLDQVGDMAEMVIQGIAEDWRPAAGRVTHWIDSGSKPVFKVTLRNGAHLKVTADHRLLSEDGWRPLNELRPGDTIGTPPALLGPEEGVGLVCDHRKLRALAYLIADGSLTSCAMVDKGLMRATGFDRQHFRSASRQRERIPDRVAASVVQKLDMPETAQRMNVAWQKIMSIEPIGIEHVYDLTVEGLHSFVANNIIVHNCIYQEQVIQILSDVAGYTPGEADLVRRGISKKARKVLDEHREIFAAGAEKKSGLKRHEADEIWDALMGFARYGFNRAHAADYAVIVAQTGYLKAHYPAEYMAALLTIERHNTDKVGVLIGECRRMGIEVLPPNVNVSANTFTIEQLPADRTPPPQVTVFPFPVPAGAAIRMGLDAIKNVGEGSVETILRGRGDRPFTSLADFADRVDLRQVNRRGLEFLIKVGALDEFGERGRLLAAIDRILGASVKAHEDREIGQMNLFGEIDASTDEDLLASLPNETKVSPKEALEWEKELVGVYVSSHPLQQMTVDLMNVFTHSTVEITEEMAKAPVVIGGVIADVRQITTKKGDPMAFVRLEDLQGALDVTVFPRLYQEARALWALDKIVVVRGKVDVRNGRVSVLADSVQDYVEGAKIIEDTSSVAYRYRNGVAAHASPQVDERPSRRYTPAPMMGVPDGDAVDDAYYGEENPFADARPDWFEESGEEPSGQGAGKRGNGGAGARRSRGAEEQGSGGAKAQGETSQALVDTARPAAPEPPPMSSVSSVRPAPSLDSSVAQEDSAPAPRLGGPPAAPRGPRTVHITFQRSRSLDADRKRLAELVTLLSRYAGDDRFQIIVEANGSACYQLDFPNNHTRICRELEDELTQRLGVGGWKVEG